MLKILLNRLREKQDKTFLINQYGSFSYADLLAKIAFWQNELRKIDTGRIIVHSGGYELGNIGLMLAIELNGCISVPVSSTELSNQEIIEIVKADYFVNTEEPSPKIEKCSMFNSSNQIDRAGIVFFTSGTSGKPKAALHDFEKLLEKYRNSKKHYITSTVLLFDHIAGFDNLFYVLFTGGCLVIPDQITPASVIKTVKRYKVELLTLTPSFLNFILLHGSELSESFRSLQTIVFSSEKMPETTLKQIRKLIPPHIRLLQKYGSTEMGSPSSRTNPDNPQMIKFNPEQISYKIVNNILYLKKSDSFQGYLNYYDENFDKEWYCTGDLVEQRDDWLHILGRESDMINVGGRKVLPQEVESVLLEMDEVMDVTVMGKNHQLMGQVVQAEVLLNTEIEKNEFIKKLRRFCKDKLASYKIPVYVIVKTKLEAGNRMKKVRVKK